MGEVERHPIATAPLDGTLIRLFHELESDRAELSPTYGHFDGRRWVMNQFFVFNWNGRAMFSRTPTHWAPAGLTSLSRTSGEQP